MTTQASAPPRRRFGRGFATWLGASTLAATGDGILFFAIGWTASGFGGRTAGLIMTFVVLPRTLLLLVGGAAGDRWGLRRTILCCDVFMCATLIGYLIAEASGAPPLILLGLLAWAIGTASAFRMPSAGAFPRLFVDDDALARALSLTSSLLQVARLIGPPLGGVVVAALGMAGAVTASLAGFVLVLCALLAIRPPYERPVAGPDGGSALGGITDGLRAARRVPGVPAVLGAVALVACGLFPMLSLCVPLAARDRGWSAGTTGLVEAAWIVGTLSTTLLVLRFGARHRPVVPLVAGTLASAAGVLVIATAQVPATAWAGALLMGVGTAGFTTHAFPLYVLRTPDGMLARFQSLLGVVQAAPMVASNNVLGAIASGGQLLRAFLVVAALSASAGALLLLSPAVRSARLDASSAQSR